MQKIELKETGIPWIGQIPQEWQVYKIKRFLRNISVKNHPDATVLSLYREYGVVPKDSRDDNHNATSENTETYKYVEKNNLVINKMKAWQGSLAVSDYEGIVSPAYYVCEFFGDLCNPKYIHYLLRGKTYAQEFERLSTGMRTGQWDLGIEDFMQLPALIPPMSEQNAIVQFLEKKLSQIDEQVLGLQEEIAMWQEWKKALIFDQVFEENECSRKKSECNWINSVPASWDEKPLKRVVISRDGGAWGEEATLDSSTICMRIADFDYERGRFKRDVDSFTRRSYKDTQIERLLLKKGDILLEKSGGGEKTPVGRSVLYDLDAKALYANFMDRLRVDESLVTPYYFQYWMQAFYYCSANIPYIKQTTGIQNLNISEMLDKEYIVLPSLEEQKNIVEKLDNQLDVYYEIVNEKQQLIDDLLLYKNSLIFEVTTGKKRVAL